MLKRLMPGLVLLLAAAPAREPVDIMVGARPLALAGAFTALSDDAAAVLWNPAGLAWNRAFEFRTDFAWRWSDTRQTTLALTGPLGHGFGAGLSYNRLTVEPDSASPGPRGDALALGPSLGWRPLHDLAVGIGCRYAEVQSGTGRLRAPLFNSGGLWRPFGVVSLGASLNGYSLADGMTSLDLRSGAAIRLPLSSGHLLVSGEADAAGGNPVSFAFGAESYSHWGRSTWSSHDSLGEHGLYLRVGYRGRDWQNLPRGWTFGAGYVYDMARFLQFGVDFIYTFSLPKEEAYRGSVYLRCFPDLIFS